MGPKIMLDTIGTGSIRSRLTRGPALYRLYWGDSPDEQIVFECSSDTRERLLRMHPDVDLATMSPLHMCLTHLHPDHVGGWAEFKAERHILCPKGEERAWHIHAPAQTIACVQTVERAYHPDAGEHIHRRAGAILHPVEQEPLFLCGSAEVRAFPVYHSDPLVHAVGYKVCIGDTVFAYTGDAASPPDGAGPKYLEGLTALFEGSQVVLSTCGGPVNGNSTRHINARQAAKLAYWYGVQTLILTHINGLDPEEDMRNACRAAGFKGRLEFAQDGKTFSLPSTLASTEPNT
ncbi:MAG: MBL fold metallo-hydrolase [Patescibacteria group bacterium]